MGTDDGKKNRGLKCPRCGCSDFRAEDGRPFDCVKTVNIPGAIRRYKICRHCGKRVRTKETLERG